MQAYMQGQTKPLAFPQAKPGVAAQSNTRFLSSADESGPAHKKARGAKQEADKSRANTGIPVNNKVLIISRYL